MNTEKCLYCNEDARLFSVITYFLRDYKCEKCGKVSSYKYKKSVESITIKDEIEISSFKKLQE